MTAPSGRSAPEIREEIERRLSWTTFSNDIMRLVEEYAERVAAAKVAEAREDLAEAYRTGFKDGQHQERGNT